MRVSDIMSAPVHTIGVNESATAAWEMMRLQRTHHLVVTAGEGHVVGVLSASDLGGRHGESMRVDRRVSDLMTEKLVAVQLDTTVREAANLMRGHAVNCLPVFNGGSRLKGVVTVVDLLELIGRGAERPVAIAARPVLKNRGVVPRQATVRNRTRRTNR
jgi:CBS domain-containing protein